MEPASDRQRHDFKDGICKYDFAISQGAYTEAARKIFEVLDRPEKVLSGREYLIGDKFASAGVFPYKPKIRFIIAYYVFPVIYLLMQTFVQVHVQIISF